MRPCWMILICIMTMLSCQDEVTNEYYGDLTLTPSGLILEASEHALGWQRADCSSCHVIDNFHQDRQDRLGTFDMEQIRQVVTTLGETSCVLCHGNNGVENTTSP